MENETINININRSGFLTLIEVENYIRETITKYQALGVAYIRDYSEISYHNGSWTATLTITTRDPNTVTNDFGF